MQRRFPFPIPRGWYQVAYSDELRFGEALTLSYFDQELVARRAESGIACVSNGRDSEWSSLERNGMLMVWYDAAGAPPLWDVPELAEFEAPGWSPYARHQMQVETCNQEVLENVADRAHFHFVHGTVNVPETVLTMTGSTLRAEQITRFKTPNGIVDGGITSNYQGLGFGTARFTGICEALLVLATTPIHAESLDVRFSLTIDESGGASTERGVGKAIIKDIIQQFVEDTPIWEHKQYKTKPLFCDGDGEIARYRSWAAQFY